jgi:hypothetical protein
VRRTWLASRLAFAALVVVASLAAGVAAWVGAATQHSPVGLLGMGQAGVNIAAPALFLLGPGALAPRLVSPFTYPSPRGRSFSKSSAPASRRTRRTAEYVRTSLAARKALARRYVRGQRV